MPSAEIPRGEKKGRKEIGDDAPEQPTPSRHPPLPHFQARTITRELTFTGRKNARRWDCVLLGERKSGDVFQGN